MRTTIDRAGRVVIPKRIRDELGLAGGEELEVVLREGRIELEPAATSMRLVEREGRVVVEADTEMPVLTVEQVRATLEHVRR